jgi:hypothetical protein
MPNAPRTWSFERLREEYEPPDEVPESRPLRAGSGEADEEMTARAIDRLAGQAG